jgi:hypothetical protein
LSIIIEDYSKIKLYLISITTFTKALGIYALIISITIIKRYFRLRKLLLLTLSNLIRLFKAKIKQNTFILSRIAHVTRNPLPLKETSIAILNKFIIARNIVAPFAIAFAIRSYL